MHSTRLILVLVLLGIVPGGIRSEPPEFLVRTVTGKEVRGPLIHFDKESVEIGKGVRRRLSSTQWLSIRQVAKRLPELPTEEHLVLANGDRVPVRDLRLDEEKVYFRHKDLNAGKEVAVPLSSLALCWRMAPDGVVRAENLRHRLLAQSRSKDLLLLRNGDTIEGTLNRIKDGQVEMEVNKKLLTARWEQIAALALSTDLLDRESPEKAKLRVLVSPNATAPGGRFTLEQASCEGKQWEAKTVFGATLSVPVERVVAVDPLGQSLVYLSDLKPEKFTYFPYLDESWGWKRDCNVHGHDLRLAGSSYDKGLGMHAPSRLSYSLKGQYRRFEAEVGLDDRDGKEGAIRLRVLVDGKEVNLGKKDIWTHEDGALLISLEVKGARELTLETLLADRGPVQAVVNWANARLLK